jgi:predicted TIM-barrel fold metal-dependent hydrolase
MRDNDISISVLSITSPGTHLKPSNDELAVHVTRQTNEELAEVCAALPNEFRFFASLPLPCVKESIEEIGHALDLGAVGFTVLSNSNGVYLGDPSLGPVFAELNRHHATVFIQPTTCNVLQHCCGDGVLAVKPLDPIPRSVVEFSFDETRTVAQLLLNNNLVRTRRSPSISSHKPWTISATV